MFNYSRSLSGLLLTLFALALAGCAAAPASDSSGSNDTAAPIKIGQLSDLTSTFTPWGVQVRDGMALAAQEINEAGGVEGRMIEIIVQDSENNGDTGVDRLERLLEDGVVAVGGILSSGVGAPVAGTPICPRAGLYKGRCYRRGLSLGTIFQSCNGGHLCRLRH